MSFKFNLPAKDHAATRFMMRAQNALANAAVMQKKRYKLNQRMVADATGIDKATISRILSGGGNPTLRTIGELAWAMKLRPVLAFVPIEELAGNIHIIEAVTAPEQIKSITRSGNGTGASVDKLISSAKYRDAP